MVTSNMLKSKQPKGSRLNNSMSEQKVQEVLQKIKNGTGGTVQYVFISERTVFSKENPQGETVYNKSFLHSNINPEVFYKLENGKKCRRSLSEVVEIFESTKVDIGASEFIID